MAGVELLLELLYGKDFYGDVLTLSSQEDQSVRFDFFKPMESSVCLEYHPPIQVPLSFSSVAGFLNLTATDIWDYVDESYPGSYRMFGRTLSH